MMNLRITVLLVLLFTLKLIAKPQELDAYMDDFVRLTPERQLLEWRKAVAGSDQQASTHSQLIHEALTVSGVRVGNELADIIQDESQPKRLRFEALHLLGDMDRFYGEDGSFGQPSSLLNVNGHRIGASAFETVQWAAQQRRDSNLRFYARLILGITRTELAQLSITEQADRWTQITKRSKGSAAMAHVPEDYVIATMLGRLLAEQAPESIHFIIEAVESDKEGYLTERALELLSDIDSCRLRLRTNAAGREAIQMMDAVFRSNRLKNVLSHEGKRHLEDRLRGQFLNDEFRTDPTSELAELADELTKRYGLGLTEGYNAFAGRGSAKPVVKKFVTFLTNQDPYFPGWGYSTCGVYHGLFRTPDAKTKLDRYYDAWRLWTNQNSESHKGSQR
jgi:hypothetical protein